MEEAIFAILATPPKKEKATGDNADEEEDTATAEDTERPTKIDHSEAIQTPQEQLPPEATRREKIDGEIYLPTPDS